MRFLWPSAFVALALVSLLVLLYVWLQRRRRRFAVRYSSLSLVRAALPAQSRLRRYLPMALFFLALASLVLSLARPVLVTQVPAGRATVILVLDVSSSMRQNDILPSRMVAAQQAALEFIDKQKDANHVGIVAFASIAQLVQAPTTDPEELENTILSLTTGRGTAIGEGIVTGLDAIAEFSQSTAAEAAARATAMSTPAAEDEYQPDIIVLLTDGNYNAGIDPLEAAQQAADSGVRVYSIGYGTQARAMGRSMAGWNMMARGGDFGLDEISLEAIASTTGGEYYTASSAGELQEVFDSLPTVLITREETLEVSVVAAAVAAMLVTGAVLLSQRWHPLP